MAQWQLLQIAEARAAGSGSDFQPAMSESPSKLRIAPPRPLHCADKSRYEVIENVANSFRANLTAFARQLRGEPSKARHIGYHQRADMCFALVAVENRPRTGPPIQRVPPGKISTNRLAFVQPTSPPHDYVSSYRNKHIRSTYPKNSTGKLRSSRPKEQAPCVPFWYAKECFSRLADAPYTLAPSLMWAGIRAVPNKNVLVRLPSGGKSSSTTKGADWLPQ